MFNINPQKLEPPDHEGVDATNKSPFKMGGRVRVAFEYLGRSVQDEIHVVENCSRAGTHSSHLAYYLRITQNPLVRSNHQGHELLLRRRSDTSAAKD